MKNALYTSIRPAEGQTVVDVIRKAHILGYELVPFEGWTDKDLGVSGNRGPRWQGAQANNKVLSEIQDACQVEFADGTVDWPHITQVVEI